MNFRILLIYLFSFYFPLLSFTLYFTSEAVTVSETPEAEAAPDVPTAEASEEDHNASQQVIQSRNSFQYKSSHPKDQIFGNKESPEEQDHTSDQKSMLWDCCL